MLHEWTTFGVEEAPKNDKAIEKTAEKIISQADEILPGIPFH
jgi:hypothetical protein